MIKVKHKRRNRVGAAFCRDPQRVLVARPGVPAKLKWSAFRIDEPVEFLTRPYESSCGIAYEFSPQ